MAPDEDAGSRLGEGAPLALLLAGWLGVRLVLAAHAPDFLDDALAAALAAWLTLSAWRTGLPGPAVGALVGAAAVATFGVAASRHPLVSLVGAPSFLTPFLVFAAVASLRATERRLLVVAVGGASVLHVAVALFQRFVSWPDALARADELQLDAATRHSLALMRPLGLTLSPDHLGALSLAGLACGGLVFLAGPPRARLLGALIASTGLVGVALSRSAGTAGALGVLGFVWLLDRRRGLAVAGLLAGGLTLFLAIGRGVDALVRSFDERWTNWSVAASAARTHLLGVGLFRFPAAYAELRPPGSNLTRYAHSTVFQWLAELGPLVGGLLVVGLGFFLVRGGRRQLAASPARSAERLALAAAAALGARCLVDYDLQVAQVGALIGAFVGGALVSPGPRASSSRSAAGLIALAAALALVTALAAQRDAVLAPFAGGSLDVTDDELAAAEAFADRWPGALFVEEAAARASVGRALGCPLDDAACAPLEEHARDRLASLEARGPSATAAVLRGRLAWRAGDVAGALAAVDAALASDPGRLEAHALRLAWMARAGHPDLAAARRAARGWLPVAEYRRALELAGLPIEEAPEDAPAGLPSR